MRLPASFRERSLPESRADSPLGGAQARAGADEASPPGSPESAQSDGDGDSPVSRGIEGLLESGMELEVSEGMDEDEFQGSSLRI